MPNFVEFSRLESRSSREDPMFTLQVRGLISLNNAAFKALGEPGAVALLYDADEHVVGLRKVPRNYANGYPVRKQANSQSYLVNAQSFVGFNKIGSDVSRRFAGHDYGDQVWGFAISEGVEVGRRRRAEKPQEDQLRLTS